MNATNAEYKYAVVKRFSFNDKIVVTILKTYDEALRFMEKDFRHDLDIIEKNYRICLYSETKIDIEKGCAILFENLVGSSKRTKWKITSNVKFK